MSEQVIVNYAVADAWKQRAEAAARVDKLARQAVKVALVAVKAKGIQASQLAEKVQLTNDSVAQAAREAEKIWTDTTAGALSGG